MKKINIFGIILLFLFFSSAKAQDDVQSGDEAFRYGFYKTAADYYKAAYKKGHDVNVAYKIAESYRLSNDYREAVKYYLLFNNSPSSGTYPHF